MSVQSKMKRAKKRRNNNLKADVVMRIFLHDTLAIRNLTNRIQELDRKLAREFVSFSRISESIENENNQILELLLEPIFRPKRLEKVWSQQQHDVARSFVTKEQIRRLLEARSDAISDIARQQQALGKVR
jgi:glycerol-3-phosphate responsive antiterminator